ncbi:hypothetical protein SAMN04488571_1164 [Methanoculleus thermophilus]|uniref:Uncharacterized protein n=1 Tax=Methanoculleus thermophilus TaxID=2200 RepID=A0A1G9CE51_9EURY|nr:hypothetical protein SAMN04488571_1164 [Methanoculleus thermophilus]
MCIVMMRATKNYKITVCICPAFLQPFNMVYFMRWMIASWIFTLSNNIFNFSLLSLG